MYEVKDGGFYKYVNLNSSNFISAIQTFQIYYANYFITAILDFFGAIFFITAIFGLFCVQKLH